MHATPRLLLLLHTSLALSIIECIKDLACRWSAAWTKSSLGGWSYHRFGRRRSNGADYYAAGRREAVRCWTLQINSWWLECDVMWISFFIRICVTVDAGYHLRIQSLVHIIKLWVVMLQNKCYDTAYSGLRIHCEPENVRRLPTKCSYICCKCHENAAS